MSIEFSPAVATAGGVDHHLLEDLLLRCAEGDQAALAELYDQTSPVLNALALARGHDPATVADALVDVYVTVWRRAGAFNYGAEASAWEWTLNILDLTLPVVRPMTRTSRVRRLSRSGARPRTD